MNHAETADSINVIELGQALKRGWRALVLCTVLGMLAAVAVLMFAPRKFAGATTVLVRTTSGGGAGGLLSKLGLGDAAPGLSTPSPIETEMAIVSSRVLVGEVVDSLKLQAVIRKPASIASRSVVQSLRLGSAFKPADYEFVKGGAGQYTVSGKGVSTTAKPGVPLILPQGTVVLRADTVLPAEFKLRLLDHEDAVTLTGKSLAVSKTGTEVLNIGYQAPDSMTASAVPNLLVNSYLARRHTVDRGTNTHRVEFLSAQIDSVSRELAVAEDSLRRFQERTGMVQPEIQGKLQLDEASAVRTQLGAIDVERGALGQLTSQIASGQMSPRQLAAYPAFLKSPGINELLAQLAQLETQRTQLLERRLDNDPEVLALNQSIKGIETQLSGLAASYRSSLEKQRIDLASQLDTISRALGTFPGAVESSGRLQRHAKELTQVYAALQAQLVEARISAIGEGGDVRQLDAAIAPKKVIFPEPVVTMGLGTGAGLFIGTIVALLIGLLGRYVEDPQAIERTAGVPALRLDAGIPLLMAGRALSSTVLLVPLDAGAGTAGVAERLARTAVARAIEPVVLDLSGKALPGTHALTTDVNSTIRRLEQEHGMVIVRLPSMSSDETAAALAPERAVLLIASPGRVDRRQLTGVMQTLRRLDVPCAGVVVNRMSDAVVAG